MMTALSLMGMDSYMNQDEFKQNLNNPSETQEQPKYEKAEPEPIPEKLAQKEKTEEETKAEEAIKEKEIGNNHYKNKQFDLALEHYSKAWELDNKNISILTNRAGL